MRSVWQRERRLGAWIDAEVEIEIGVGSKSLCSMGAECRRLISMVE